MLKLLAITTTLCVQGTTEWTPIYRNKGITQLYKEVATLTQG